MRVRPLFFRHCCAPAATGSRVVVHVSASPLSSISLCLRTAPFRTPPASQCHGLCICLRNMYVKCPVLLYLKLPEKPRVVFILCCCCMPILICYLLLVLLLPAMAPSPANRVHSGYQASFDGPRLHNTRKTIGYGLVIHGTKYNELSNAEK